MRFRAAIENVPTFYRIVQAIEKLQKKCIIKFTPTDMHIICNNGTNESGIQVWSQIKVPSLFTAYRIQSNAENVITLSLTSSSLLQALHGILNFTSSYATNSEEIVMKLAKKNDQAVLTFDLSGTTRQGRKQNLTYDVGIIVMKPADVKRLSEPLCPEPDTHILLPPLPKIRTTVDRLRLLSDDLYLRANNAGRLELAVKTDKASVDVAWEGLSNPKMRMENGDEPEPSQDRDREKTYSVLVSIKSFLKFLNSHVISTTTIACLCHNYCAILYVYIGDVADAGGVLTFYIPAFIDD